MKRLLLLFLLFISCRVLAEDTQFTRISTYAINSVNPTPVLNLAGAQFPGYRGADQLIVYTPDYGMYTGTNEFGREATVMNGVVFGFNGANSFIPINGYVISGHGEAKKWINQNLIEGAKVSINFYTKTIESIITPESYLYKAEHKLNEVRKIVLYYKRTLPGYQYSSAQKYYSSSVNKFQAAKYLTAQGKFEQAMNELNASLSLSQKAFYYAIPAMSGEFHGIWIRPVEKNITEIKNTVQRLKNTGIDNIFLETYYHGYTIFPSSTMDTYGLTAQRSEFLGWDPLKEWIKAAHDKNIKVHIWFQTFYTGNEDVTKTPGHILNAYPEWANVQKKNALESTPKYSVSEHNGYFLDPANPMVKQFLLSLIKEINDKYEIDGLNIDYIRYPKSLTTDSPDYLGSTWGYSKYARDEFKKTYGEDPLNIDEKHNLWVKWVEYRQNKITDFISNIKQYVDNKNTKISAVIFPDAKDTFTTKLQKWPEWAKCGYIDAFTPLIMSSDEFQAEKSVLEIAQLSDKKVLIYPGLFEPFTAGPPETLLSQIVSARKAGAAGIVLFDNAHLNDLYIEALNTRIFRN